MYPPYRIFETEPFARDIAALASSVKRRLGPKLRTHVYTILAQEPHFGANIKRLRNWNPPTWRYRIAEWRVFYEIDEAEKVVFMTGIKHRKQAYH